MYIWKVLHPKLVDTRGEDWASKRAMQIRFFPSKPVLQILPLPRKFIQDIKRIILW